ncbi:carboxypeptidase-like regulatory domain-containing protein, partial [bacterium]|nr:carboxypeptidase-like regulatory domain-containing protein [bacterium]
TSARIRGRVTDDLGKPMAGCYVTAYTEWDGFFVKTDDNGYYSLPSPGRGLMFCDGCYDIVSGYGDLLGRLYQVPTGTDHADIVLKSSRWRVTGSVVDAYSHQPVTPITITEQIQLDRARQGMKQYSFSTPQGGFSFETTFPGERHLYFIADGYQTMERIITLNEDTPFEIAVDVEMQPNDEAGSLAGFVQMPDGTSLIRAEAAGGFGVDCVNNGFHFERLPVGKYAIFFYAVSIHDRRMFRFGVLPDVEVRAGERVNLGRIDAAQLQSFALTR